MAKKKLFEKLFVGVVKKGEEQQAENHAKAQVSEEYIKKHISVKEELKNLIPPLTQIEFEKLEENILKEGCRDPLVLWKLENDQKEYDYILVDGHNRYNICTKHELAFNIALLSFEHINQVKDWMLNNQFGKRNITEETKSYLRGMQYSREKNSVGTNQFTNHKKNINQNDNNQHDNNQQENQENNTKKPKKSQTPLEYLAQNHKVSTKTIQRDEKYFVGLNKLTGTDNLFRWQILRQELPISRTKIIEWLDEEGKKDGIHDLAELGKKIKEIAEVIREKQHFDMDMLDMPIAPPIKKIAPPVVVITSHQKQIKGLAKNIKNCLRTSLEEESIEAIIELRQYLDKLEQVIKEKNQNQQEETETQSLEKPTTEQ